MILFKTFSDFLLNIRNIDQKPDAQYVKKLEREGERTTKKYISYAYLAEEFFDNLSTRSLENVFHGSPIADDRMQSFCEKFKHAYDNLSSAEKDNYRVISLAFHEWQREIYERFGWNLNIRSDNNTINKEVPDNFSIGNNQKRIRKVKRKQIKHGEFIGAVEAISKYYSHLRKGILRKEHVIAQSYLHFVSQRTFSSNYRIGLEDILELFTDYEWEIYEIHDKKIVRRSVQFLKFIDNHFSVDGVGFKIILGRKEKIVVDENVHSRTVKSSLCDLFDFDIAHNLIMITERDLDKSGQVSKYNFQYLEGKNILPGHKCLLNCNGVLISGPSFLVRCGEISSPIELNYGLTVKSTSPIEENLELPADSYYSEEDIDIIRTGDDVKATLLGWKHFEIFPFKNISVTINSIMPETYQGPFDIDIESIKGWEPLELLDDESEQE